MLVPFLRPGCRVGGSGMRRAHAPLPRQPGAAGATTQGHQDVAGDGSERAAVARETLPVGEPCEMAAGLQLGRRQRLHAASAKP